MNRFDQLKELCRANGIEILYAFGSRSPELPAWLQSETVRLPEKANDVDIGVEYSAEAAVDVRKKAKTAIELEDFFDVSRVDLVSFDDADPFVAANIVRGERLYCEDVTAADEFELFILRRAGDLAPFERQRLLQIEQRYESGQAE